MAILERMSFKVIDDQWDAVMAQEKEWDALESKAGGFPKKRRYHAYAGAMSHRTPLCSSVNGRAPLSVTKPINACLPCQKQKRWKASTRGSRAITTSRFIK